MLPRPRGKVRGRVAAGTNAGGRDNVLCVKFRYVHIQTFISFFIHIHTRPFLSIKVCVRRLIVEEERPCEVLLGLGHLVVANDCLCVVERGEGEGRAAYGEGLLIIELCGSDALMFYIVVVIGLVAVIRGAFFER